MFVYSHDVLTYQQGCVLVYCMCVLCVYEVCELVRVCLQACAGCAFGSTYVCVYKRVPGVRLDVRVCVCPLVSVHVSEA